MPSLRRVSVRIGLIVTVLVLALSAVQALAMRAVLVGQALEVRRTIVGEGVALVRLAAHGNGDDPAALRDELGSLPGMAVVFYDEEGRVLARSRDDIEIVDALTPEVREAAARAAGEAHYLRPPYQGNRTEAIASTGRLPVAYVGVFEDSPVAAFHSIRIGVPVAVTVVALFVALLITVLLTRRVRGSLARTESVVRRMSDGDLSVRLAEGGDDEVGQLMRDFNRMADRLAEHVQRLEGEDERRKRLFAAFTHEINTPLTSVLGYLESLSMPDIDADPETRRRYLGIAFEQAQQLGALADDLTTLSRLEYDGVTLERTELDLRALIEREVEAFGPRAEARRVSVAVEGPSFRVSLDRPRIAQVIRILIDNAVRHAREGTVVRVRLSEQARSFEVVDEGDGMAPEHLALVGTPLFRTDAARDRPRGGRGLGLAIARGLVLAHGGRLDFTSRLGEGTTARVVLES